MTAIDDFVDYFTSVQDSDGWSRVLDSFARFVAPPPDAHVLDVGCGPGALVRRFARLAARADGCDSHPGMIERARDMAQRAGISNTAYRPGELPSLPYDKAAFDVVTATNVVFLQRDPQGALREMARVCRPGGWVAMLNPSPAMTVAAATAHMDRLGAEGFNRQSFINWSGVAERNHRFAPERIARMFAAAGLGETLIQEKIDGLALFAKGRKRDTDKH
jgi:ubiquinone/menaquinone biosynthesis C-methylase UbiE